MPIRSTRSSITPGPQGEAPAWLVDDMLDCYIKWRLAAGAEREAYEDWACTAGRTAERGLRFAAYIEAVDQEESAACSYERAVRTLELRLARKAPAAA